MLNSKVWWKHQRLYTPIKALGIVILSHILSLTSRPESGAAIVFTTVLMSVFTESPSPSGSSVYPRTKEKINTK